MNKVTTSELKQLIDECFTIDDRRKMANVFVEQAVVVFPKLTPRMLGPRRLERLKIVAKEMAGDGDELVALVGRFLTRVLEGGSN